MLIAFIFSLVLSFILIYLNSSVSFKMYFDREKMISFECGYDPKSMSRLPFSLHFYLLAVIFLIFDVEITIFLPMPIIFLNLNNLEWMLLTMFFIIVLVVGTIHEWNEGSLEWVK